jgi:hypothetical protein
MDTFRGRTYYKRVIIYMMLMGVQLSITIRIPGKLYTSATHSFCVLVQCVLFIYAVTISVYMLYFSISAKFWFTAILPVLPRIYAWLHKLV